MADMQKKAVLPVLLLAVIWGGYYVASQKTIAGLSIFTAGFAIRFVTWIFLTILMALKKELRLETAGAHWCVWIPAGRVSLCGTVRGVCRYRYSLAENRCADGKPDFRFLL
ncbi:hypothetical protein [Shinella sp.]|uniref:hypothetical protein n=1 Tax=Shinella sp. TaxID=1870904 RepID=UPI0028A0DCB8|nr:hypothetical protein [Shinella sp.]